MLVLRIADEPQRDPGQPTGAPGVDLAGSDDEQACVVVGAIAALDAGLGAVGVLEQPAFVAHPLEVGEGVAGDAVHGCSVPAPACTSSASA